MNQNVIIFLLGFLSLLVIEGFAVLWCFSKLSVCFVEPVHPLIHGKANSCYINNVMTNESHVFCVVSVIQDKFCGIINISVEALHDVMTEDPESGTFKE